MNTEFYRGLFTTMQQSEKKYEPNGSNWHDHLCSCPGCVPDDPDPTDEEIQRMEQEQAWQDLQSVERYESQFCTHGQYKSLCPECSPLA